MEKMEMLKFWDSAVKSCGTKFHVVLQYIEWDGKRSLFLEKIPNYMEHFFGFFYTIFFP